MTSAETMERATIKSKWLARANNATIVLRFQLSTAVSTAMPNGQVQNEHADLLTATGPEVRGTHAGTEVAHDQRRNNRTLSNEEHSLRVCILVEKPLQRVNPTSKCARQLF